MEEMRPRIEAEIAFRLFQDPPVLIEEPDGVLVKNPDFIKVRDKVPKIILHDDCSAEFPDIRIDLMNTDGENDLPLGIPRRRLDVNASRPSFFYLLE